MNAAPKTNNLRSRSWKCVVVSMGCILIGIPIAATFSPLHGIGRVQLPGGVITCIVLCGCTACFLRCPRLPLDLKLTTFALIIVPILCVLQFFGFISA